MWEDRVSVGVVLYCTCSPGMVVLCACVCVRESQKEREDLSGPPRNRNCRNIPLCSGMNIVLNKYIFILTYIH